MGVKIIIERKFKEPLRNEDIHMIEGFRVPALKQKGYISGETLISYDDPTHVLVISSWTDLDSFNEWAESEERQTMAGNLAPFLAEPEKIRSYLLGADALDRIFENVIHDADAGS